MRSNPGKVANEADVRADAARGSRGLLEAAAGLDAGADENEPLPVMMLRIKRHLADENREFSCCPLRSCRRARACTGAPLVCEADLLFARWARGAP